MADKDGSVQQSMTRQQASPLKAALNFRTTIAHSKSDKINLFIV